METDVEKEDFIREINDSDSEEEEGVNESQTKAVSPKVRPLSEATSGRNKKIFQRVSSVMNQENKIQYRARF